MAFRGIDCIDSPAIADDSSVAGTVVQLARNLEAVVADRPLQVAISWRTAQRWHAPWIVYHGPFWAGYSETPIESLVVHVSHDGRVSSTGEADPADGLQVVKMHATAYDLVRGADPPPPVLADWVFAFAELKP